MSVKLDYKDTVKKENLLLGCSSSRCSKRDGKYLEKIGTYNPNTNPATIDLNLDSAVRWLHDGAQPTDTAKAIFLQRSFIETSP
jgi:small subunit ribosomal protein S16